MCTIVLLSIKYENQTEVQMKQLKSSILLSLTISGTRVPGAGWQLISDNKINSFNTKAFLLNSGNTGLKQKLGCLTDFFPGHLISASVQSYSLCQLPMISWSKYGPDLFILCGQMMPELGAKVDTQLYEGGQSGIKSSFIHYFNLYLDLVKIFSHVTLNNIDPLISNYFLPT